MLLENYRQLLQIVGNLVNSFLFCLLSIIGICIRGCDMTVVSLRYDHQGVCKSTPWYFSYRIEGQKAKTRGSLYFIDDGIFKRTVVFSAHFILFLVTNPGSLLWHTGFISTPCHDNNGDSDDECYEHACQ